MEALGEWLRQIIVVVLIAAFIDLLLPNRSMQRYVKLVVSLFILMTILSPVLQLFGGNANLRMLASTVEGWSVSGLQPTFSGTGTKGGGTIPALGELLSDAEELARQRSAHSMVLLEQRLESMISDHLRSQHGINEARVNASIHLDEEGVPAIRSIQIRIGSGPGGGEETPDDGAAQWMEPIQPVVIEPVAIQPIQIGTEARREDPSPADEPLSRQPSEGKRPVSPGTIAESVARAWSIPVSRVSVMFME